MTCIGDRGQPRARYRCRHAVATRSFTAAALRLRAAAQRDHRGQPPGARGSRHREAQVGASVGDAEQEAYTARFSRCASRPAAVGELAQPQKHYNEDHGSEEPERPRRFSAPSCLPGDGGTRGGGGSVGEGGYARASDGPSALETAWAGVAAPQLLPAASSSSSPPASVLFYDVGHTVCRSASPPQARPSSAPAPQGPHANPTHALLLRRSRLKPICAHWCSQATAFFRAGPSARFKTALLTGQAGVGVQVLDGSEAEWILELVTHQLPCSRKTISKHHHPRRRLWALSWALQAQRLIAESDDD